MTDARVYRIEVIENDYATEPDFRFIWHAYLEGTAFAVRVGNGETLEEAVEEARQVLSKDLPGWRPTLVTHIAV